jgi:thioredoxin 1
VLGKAPEERILELNIMKMLQRFAALFVLATLFVVAISYQAVPSHGNEATLGTTPAATTEVKATDLTDANQKTVLANTKAPIVIDFYADWCGPCRQLSPNIDALAKLYKGKVTVARCNTDFNPNLCAKYGPISRIPCVVIVLPNGTYTSHIGYKSVAELQKLVDAALKP